MRLAGGAVTFPTFPGWASPGPVNRAPVPFYRVHDHYPWSGSTQLAPPGDFDMDDVEIGVVQVAAGRNRKKSGTLYSSSLPTQPFDASGRQGAKQHPRPCSELVWLMGFPSLQP